MSRTPSDATRAKDRERKRKAYQPKTERGDIAKKARAFAVAFEAWTRDPNMMLDTPTMESAWALVDHFKVRR